MKRLQILHVISGMDPAMGGVCQALRTLIPSLEKLGVHNEVVSLDSPDAAFIKEELFVIHAIGPGKGPWNYSRTIGKWLSNNISRFDTIILHGLWQFPGYAIERALRTLKNNNGSKVPKLFVMPHGMLDPYFQRARGRKLKAFRNWIYWKLVEQYVVNKADGLLFTCESELQLARIPFTPYSPKKEEVVGLGIDEPPTFTPNMKAAFQQKCPELQNCSYILFLSRIHPKKGVDLLIEAYSSIIKTEYAEIASSSVPRLVIAGPGLDTPYGRKMKDLASFLLPGYIYFPGMLTKDAKWGAFYGCESFTLPSHQENFGIAVAEALACSKPVIISNQVNIWREIDESGGGIIADDTYEMTRQSLKTWITSSFKMKQQMAEKARVTYEKKFAIETNVVRLRKAIEIS